MDHSIQIFFMHNQFRDIFEKTTGVEGDQQWGNETQWWKDFKAQSLTGLHGSCSDSWHMNLSISRNEVHYRSGWRRIFLTECQKERSTVDRYFDPWAVLKCQNEWFANQYWEKDFFREFGFFCFYWLIITARQRHRVVVNSISLWRQGILLTC